MTYVDDLPEGLHVEVDDHDNVIVVDAQEHTWITFHPAARSDPMAWKRTIISRTLNALGVKV
jgi:hypothetical protein